MQHMTDRHVEPIAPRVEATELRGAPHVALAIAGMDCPNCANRIRNALMAHPGVLEAQADVPAALARVWYDPTQVRVAEILAVVTLVGEGTQHQYLPVPITPTRGDR